MEKDIQLLKEIQENCIKGMMKGAIYTDEKAERKALAIENILNRIEQDEEVINEMAKYLSTKNYADDICEFRLDVKGRFHKHCYKGECENCIIDYFRKKCE